ncbi:lipoprotein [Mangrovibacter sp. MFB070]|uniref:lipoprotein YedD n=1 Tax=Mangrovibacter sp. MFB070 TaxID=1224318 RepID=UPI0004D833D6|nr:lipoprotein YedD [Mangrovibacter sp. MFB070]KEA51555.1 lipoprotein [Mangrovibacter sp. MFB070]
MKKITLLPAIAALMLAGCVQVDDYTQVVKAPAPQWLVGYWQSAGPQSKLVSPEAIASLVVTKEGDTLDCRQWQRVIAEPGKLMQRGDTLYNVTQKRDIYTVELDGETLDYAGMTLKRVDKPTVECQAEMGKLPQFASAAVAGEIPSAPSAQ